MLREPEARSEQRLSGGRAERHQPPRADQLDLRVEPGHARVDLALARRLVDAALAALLEFEVLDHVGHVDLRARDAGFLERAVELAAGRADERPPFAVLTVAGHLADEHDPGRTRALAEDGLRRGLEEGAAAAPRRGLPQRGQSSSFRDELG